MGSLFLGLITVVLFCVCCHFFIKSIVKKAPALQRSQFNKAALRLQRGYQVFALGTMTFVFLIGLVVSFYQVYALI